MSLIRRVSGGIWYAAADTGSKLANKLTECTTYTNEHLNNPGSLANLLGQHLSDNLGYGSDLSESFINSIIAALILAPSVNG